MGQVVHLEPRMLAFEDFWEVYPKRTGKPLARAKWEAITNGGLKTRTLDRDSGSYVHINLQASPEEIIEGAWRYRAAQIDSKLCRADDLTHTILKDGGKYTCHPATWLNQGRWEDE